MFPQHLYKVLPLWYLQKPQKINQENQETLEKEESWINHVLPLLDRKLSDESKINWAGFHSANNRSFKKPDIVAVLPLFYEKATYPGMVVCGLSVIKNSIEYINPVATCDLQLYIPAKTAQWIMPESFEEDKVVILPGGFHIEMNLLKTIGDTVEGSG